MSVSVERYPLLHDQEAEVKHGDDLHIQDIKKYVHSLFEDDTKDHSNVYIDVATSNSSALKAYPETDHAIEPNSIFLGTDGKGVRYYAASMTYTILREHVRGNLKSNHAGIISYVPVVLSGDRGVSLDLGNAWPRHTLSMFTYHNFKDIQAPPITQLSLVDAINQVLITLADGCKTFPKVQRFIIGYKIVEILAKTIRYYGIKLRDCDLSDFGPLELDKDWRKLIMVLIFDRDAPGLSSDIQNLSNELDFAFGTFYDCSSNWESALNRDALITYIVATHGSNMFGSYEYYMDTMYDMLDDLNEHEVFGARDGFVSTLCNRMKSIKESISFGLSNSEDIELGLSYLQDIDPMGCHPDECFTGDIVSCRGKAAGIRYESGLRPMIMPSTNFQFDVRMPRLKARITIEGEEITLKSRSLSRLLREHGSRVTGVSIMKFGLSLSALPQRALKGSMVANLAMSGTLGSDAGLWVLSHILHGDLSVSESSSACYAQLLASPGGKLNLTAPISADIMRFIHTVTDEISIYSVWCPRHIMKLNRNNGEWHATIVTDLSRNDVKSCKIRSRRPTASLT